MGVPQIPLKRDRPAYKHADEVDGSRIAAQRIVPRVIEIVGSVDAVVDVGGGTGAWLEVFAAAGAKKLFLVDTPSVRPYISSSVSLIQADLATSFPALGRVDLALCLECAEHLPARRAVPLVKWLTSVSEIVLFSAAVVAQGGKGHINERPQEYWQSLFAEAGYVRHDVLRNGILHDASIPWWYRQNLFLFSAASSRRVHAGRNFMPADFELIHSGVRARLENPGLRRAASQVFRSAWNFVRRDRK